MLSKLVKIDESRGYHFLERRTCVENGNIVNVICVESQAQSSSEGIFVCDHDNVVDSSKRTIQLL